MPERKPKVFTNEAGTIRVFREKYRGQHPKAGEYNPVWKATLRIRKGDKGVPFNTKSKHREYAIRAAQSRLDQMIAMDAMGLPVTPLTFGEVARRYLKFLEHRDAQCSEEKYAHHERTIRNHLNPVFEKDEIGRITSGRITKLFFDIETTPMKATEVYGGARKITRKREFYSASAINKMKQVLRAILRFARDQNILNNVPEISSTKIETKLKKGLTREQWEELHEYLITNFVNELDIKPTNQSRAKYYRQAFVDYFRLVVWTGLRTSEALRLQWRDISIEKEDGFEYCLINVAAREKLARKTGQRMFRADMQVWEMLQKRKMKATQKTATDYIFCHFDRRFNYNNEPYVLPIKSMRGTFTKALDNLGMLYTEEDIKLTPYQGRHSHALLARELGKPLDDIAEDIGNLTQTTERFYVGRGQGTRKGKPIRI
jgi:integrase